MNVINLALLAILHRKSVAELAKDLGESRAKAYRVFAGEQSTDCLNEDTVDDVVHNYPLPDFHFSDDELPALFPRKLKHRRHEMMQCLIQHYCHDPIGVDLYIQEIRTLINEGSSYDPDTQTVHVDNSMLEDAKAMLMEFPTLKGIPGWKKKVSERWATFNTLTIKILQQEASEGFEELPEVLFESIQFVHQLKSDVLCAAPGSREKRHMEDLFVKGTGQTIELMFLGKNTEYAHHLIQPISEIFGKASETPFRTLLVGSFRSHTRPLVYEYFGVKPFPIYQEKKAA